MDPGEIIRKRIDLIAAGIPFKFGNMTIQANDPGKLLVTGWIKSISFSNISKENVIKELVEVKSSFSNLTKSFTGLIGSTKKYSFCYINEPVTRFENHFVVFEKHSVK